MRKKSNFSIFTWGILFSVGLGVGIFIGNFGKERTALVQIVPSEYIVQKSSPPKFDDFKVYDSDKLLSEKDITRKDSFASRQDDSFDEKNTILIEQNTNEQTIELPEIEPENESQFYEHLENNVFKNLRAEPPYSVPQIDEKVRSLRVKRYLPPSNKGQHNENFEAEGIVGRK
ncbi:TPA: hypothetical protein ACGT9B_004788 [Klebsiella pneumoniae]|uniref:hypothetical protein n=1 Tax=Klebsiella oxytoca TaxID=571 RepID=UPI0025930C5B|nr:hypothetical protein [Klebsiella oxytoca]MDM4303064.1 hypothetical protein [Klebsiella oxytoca]